MKTVARYPHVNNTWFALGHTVGDPADPLSLDPAGRFTGVVLLTPATFPEGASSLPGSDGRIIRFLAIYPLFPEELAYARERGPRDLEDRLIDAGVTEVIDLSRRPVV